MYLAQSADAGVESVFRQSPQNLWSGVMESNHLFHITRVIVMYPDQLARASVVPGVPVEPRSSLNGLVSVWCPLSQTGDFQRHHVATQVRPSCSGAGVDQEASLAGMPDLHSGAFTIRPFHLAVKVRIELTVMYPGPSAPNLLG